MSEAAAPTVTAKAKPFDINEGATPLNNALFPTLGDTNLIATDIVGYARAFETLYGTDDPMSRATKSLGIDKPAYAKALNAPPSAFSFGRISYAPDAAVNGGVIQWPGINPDSLRKVARENIAPQLIIGMRVDDIIRYSSYSNHIWRPGWHIEAVDHADNEKKGLCQLMLSL